MDWLPRAPAPVWLALAGMALAVVAASCGAPPAPTAIAHTPTPAGTAVAVPTLTPIPGIKATLTALPKQPPLAENASRPYQELLAAIERCNVYNENRKIGILNQINYVLKPATVPSDFVILYGDEWQGRLVYGAAYMSALEWKLGGRDRASCLYPIGVAFNALLRELHQSTFPEFE